MSIPISVLLAYIGILFSAIGSWYAMKFGLDRANEKIAELKQVRDKDKEDAKEEQERKMTEVERQMRANWKRQDDHEKEANEMREKFNKDISRLEGGQLVQTEQFKQIMAVLQDIKTRMDHLEKR